MGDQGLLRKEKSERLVQTQRGNVKALDLYPKSSGNTVIGCMGECILWPIEQQEFDQI